MIEHAQSMLVPLFAQLQAETLNKHRTKHLVEVVRNLCFEYEKYALDFLQLNLLEVICHCLVREHGLT